MESNMVASCRIPRKGELLGLCFLISASGGLLWAVPCGATASLHHWASRDVVTGQGCPHPLIPAGLALRYWTLGCSDKELLRSDIYAASHGLCFCFPKTVSGDNYPHISLQVSERESLAIWKQFSCDHLPCIYPGTWSWTKQQSAKPRQR